MWAAGGGPVGQGGGWGAGWGPGGWRGGKAIQWGLRGAKRSHPDEDKHKAPSSTLPRPLSLQDPGPQAPQWLGFPDSVVNIQYAHNVLAHRRFIGQWPVDALPRPINRRCGRSMDTRYAPRR